jgi:lipopolysaccharide/colanic/teichoic acid biosynthesis glycosyltransferase
MSLVGPRPEVPRYVALYPAALREKILSVRPGITDFASIEFRDENDLLAGSADPDRAYREEVLPRKLALQARYVDAAGVATDLTLIARTLAALLKR